jgi:hypothetical protein
MMSNYPMRAELSPSDELTKILDNQDDPILNALVERIGGSDQTDLFPFAFPDWSGDDVTYPVPEPERCLTFETADKAVSFF